jgi:uncharacterized protein (DUF1015 family)
MPGVRASSPVESSSRTGGLVVAPFRALRYDPARVSGLAAVLSPPYDVIDEEEANALARADPHNIVRLILPSWDDCGPEGPYEHAGRTMRSWIGEGVLRRDPEPALYVLEQQAAGVRQRGLVGALDLRAPNEQIVLPHEEVMPGPVEDRLALLRATEANLEPIFLVYDGGGIAMSIVEATASGTPPVLSATTDDGDNHRLWALTDPEQLAAIAADLRPRQALIADGHHRYAASLRYQAERRQQHGPGPWDFSLSLLVDTASTPPHLTSIARVVPGLAFPDALRSAEPFVRATPAATLAEALHLFETHDGDFPMLLAGGGTQLALLSIVDPAHAQSSPVEFLHEVLFPQHWHVADPNTQVLYVHDVDVAVKLAEESKGVAIMLRPPSIEQVLQVARTGTTMPRKSTSFGPKPRDGLVLRTLAPQ